MGSIRLAQAEFVLLVSLWRPVVLMGTLLAWAKLVCVLDRDMAHFYLPRRRWNGGQITAATVALGFWLIIPWFWFGWLIAVTLMGGAASAYTAYRNLRVPDADRWVLSWSGFSRRWERSKQSQAQRLASVRILNPAGGFVEVPVGQGTEAVAHQLLESVLEFAIPRGASGIHVAVEGRRSGIVVNIDGVKHPQPPVEPAVAMSLIDYLKKRAGLDVADRRHRLTGHMKVQTDQHGRHDLRVQSSGSTRQVSVAVQIDPDSRGGISFELLGLLPTQIQQLEEVLDQPNRLIIVASPPGQGQSTTLYSLLNRHDPYTHSIVTLEDEPGVEMEGVRHQVTRTGSSAEQDYHQLWTKTLQQDPQILMLARLVDASMAGPIVTAARERRVYLGMHQSDTFAALRAWWEVVAAPRDTAETLGAIVAQRLVRKLCPTCRVAYTPDAKLLQKLNLSSQGGERFYKHSGQVLINNRSRVCPDCLGLGYRGRVGVFEVLAMDGQVRQLLLTAQFEKVRARLRNKKMLWLQEAALAKVVEGVTSSSEVARVLGKQAPHSLRESGDAVTSADPAQR